jgi:hypothetical protein
MFCLAAMGISVAAGSCFSHPLLRLGVYCACLFSLWTILGIFSRQTLHWLKSLIFAEKAKVSVE